MADEHRRVEPRAIISGSGMASDPERIAEIESQAARYERATAPRPKVKFGEVLQQDGKRRAEARLQDDDEAQARQAAAEQRAREERETIRRLMGGGSVHPEHAEHKRKVALKG